MWVVPEILESRPSPHEASYQEDLEVSLLMMDSVKGVLAGDGELGGGGIFRIWKPARAVGGCRTDHVDWYPESSRS